MSETTHGSGAWWEVDFGYEVPEINKVDFYHSSKIDERVALNNYIFLFYNKNRSQLHAPEFYLGPNDSLYPVYSGIYLSGNVPCRYVRVQQAVDHSQLEIAELKVY